MSKPSRISCDWVAAPRHTTPEVSRIRTPRRVLPVPEASDFVESTVLHTGCSFCRCWMAEWFRLAEIVGEERRAAGSA